MRGSVWRVLQDVGVVVCRGLCVQRGCWSCARASEDRLNCVWRAEGGELGYAAIVGRCVDVAWHVVEDATLQSKVRGWDMPRPIGREERFEVVARSVAYQVVCTVLREQQDVQRRGKCLVALDGVRQ